ncbi:MAG: DNA adenine methylase [Fimbriimonadaceae bacterium]
MTKLDTSCPRYLSPSDDGVGGEDSPTLVGVNIASAPKYSPFRYPGGKTWLAPVLREWLSSKPKQFICEPFAGGGIASLIAVYEGYVENALLVEKDRGVAAVWRASLSQEAERLVDKILAFKISKSTVGKLLSKVPRSNVDLAFQTIVKNRCRHGGILTESAGLLIRGEREKGLSSRWYPETLANRICLIHLHRKQIAFLEEDGLKVLRQMNTRKEKIKLFVDPPYPKLMQSGVRPLYNHVNLDHPKLFELLRRSKHDFLTTYDDSIYARKLAFEADLCCTTIAMKNNRSAAKVELLIGRNAFRPST